MRILKRIFGNEDKGVFSTIEGISSRMDDWRFTEEERSRVKLKAAKSLGEFVENTANESTVRSISRRYVSYFILLSYFSLLLLFLATCFFDIGEKDVMERLVFDSAYSTSFVMVIAFYFGGYYLNQSLLTKKREKEVKNGKD